MPVLRCKDCKKEFQLTGTDMNIPLDKLVEQGKIEAGHVWWLEGKYDLRHLTYEDYLEELADREICSVCGVVHGPNPTTGCEL